MRTKLSNISDKELLNNFSLLVRRERIATNGVVVHLAEIYRRRLYAREGYSSLFAYIQHKFHYSGSAAYRRIQVAKLSLKFTEVISLLERGKVNLAGLCLIEPYVTTKNGGALIEKIIGKTKQEIDYFLANTFPRAEKTQDKMRRLPVIKKVIPIKTDGTKNEQSTASEAVSYSELEERGISKESSTSQGSKSGPLLHTELPQNPPTKIIEIRRVKLECVIDEKVANKLERAREVLRKKYPKGRFEDILNEALDLLLEKKDPERKIKRMEKKRKVSKRQSTEILRRADGSPQNDLSRRYISQYIRQQVWKRDNGRCQYQSSDGKKCNARGGLEIDHIKPFALGGNHTLDNLRLLCIEHNRWRSEETFKRVWRN